jgi:hypothetical protein
MTTISTALTPNRRDELFRPAVAGLLSLADEEQDEKGFTQSACSVTIRLRYHNPLVPVHIV